MVKLDRVKFNATKGIPMAVRATLPRSNLDEVRQRILTLCEDQGVSLREASIKLGKNPAYLQQHIHRGTPASLPEAVRIELAGMLGIQPILLANEDMRRHLANIRRMDVSSTHTFGSRLPIAGYARGGLDVLTYNEDDPSAYVDRPAELEGVDDAFAVEIVGESHAPRCRPGEIVLVNPRLSPSRGVDVVVRLTDGSATIGEYQGSHGQKVRLIKHGAAALEIPLDTVAGIYSITHIVPRPNRYNFQ
jgi:SOS-response transcriptional repressor LexA